jgi:protoporphyrinogen oxidase
MKSSKKHWGIVGGGILGMYLALKLSESGEHVTLIEAKSELGGLATSWKIGEVEWDKFYHVILLSDSKLSGLLDKLDLGKALNWVETKTGFFTEGNLYSMSNTLEFLQFPPLSFLDKLRLGFTIFYASRIKDWKALEHIAVADWLTKWSGKNTFEKIWLPLLRAKLGNHYQKTAATFIWTTIQRMYKARRTGLKKEMFGYVSGGYKTIINALKKQLEANGVTIFTGEQASTIRSENNNAVTILNSKGVERVFDEVIVTIPSQIAAGICQGLSAVEQKKHKQIEYLGVVCASILLKQKITPFYVTNITDQTPFTGIIEMTNIVDPAFFGGKHLVYLPRYINSKNPIYHWKDHQIALLFKNALFAMYPELPPESIETIKIAKAPNVFALPTLNYTDNLPPVSTSIPGLYILNSAHIVNGTLNVNETIQLAEQQLPSILQSAQKRTMNYEPTF